eukprot:180844-Ditylum_brightwellii.AAC.1
MMNTVALTTTAQCKQQETLMHTQAMSTLIPVQLITSKYKIRTENLRTNKRFRRDERIKEEDTFRFWLQNPNDIK